VKGGVGAAAGGGDMGGIYVVASRGRGGPRDGRGARTGMGEGPYEETEDGETASDAEEGEETEHGEETTPASVTGQ
jgi:hypothetical protein